MNRKKAVLAALMAAVIALAFILSSCTGEEKPETISKKALTEKVENKTQAYMTDLLDSRDTFTSNKKIQKYLMNWAESKGIRAKEADGIVTMLVDGSERYKNVPPTVLVCSYDEHAVDETLSTITMALYIAKNNEDTGRLTVMFVPETGHNLSYADKLDKKYFKKGSRVICIDGGEMANVAAVTGGASHYNFTEKLAQNTPKNEKAYKVIIRGISSSKVDNRINYKINPIMELNTLLANLKKSSIDFEIVSMNGGKRDMLYPGSCTLVMTVDEDRQAAFEKKIQSRIQSFDRRKQSADPDAEYVYKEVPVPSKSLTQKSSSQVVSFVYTLLEDEYLRDEETDDLLAVCDVSYIRVNKGKALVGSTAYSIDKDVLDEIDDAEETLCGLSGFRYKKISGIPSWAADAENSISEMIKNAYNDYTGKKMTIQPTVTPTCAGYIEKLNDKCDIIALTVSHATMTDLTGTLLTYLIDSDQDK